MSNIIVRNVFKEAHGVTPEWCLALLLSGKKATTINTRVWGLKQFATFTGCKTPREACEKLIAAGKQGAQLVADMWRGEMYASGLAPETINVCIQSLRRFAAICRRYGVIDWELEVANVPTVDYRKTHGCGYDGWIKLSAFLESKHDAAGRRDFAMVCLMWDLALRRAEVWSLDVASLRFDLGVIELQGKGREQIQQFPIPGPTAEALKRWIEIRGERPGPVFTNLSQHAWGRLDKGSIWRIINKRGKQAGVDDLHPHVLRHAVCTHLLRKGVPILDVMEFMRHRRVETTMRYFKNVDGVGLRVARIAASCRRSNVSSVSDAKRRGGGFLPFASPNRRSR